MRSGAGRRLWSRRAAGFLWYFLSLRKKVLPLRGGSPTIRAVVGASCSNRGKGVCAHRRTNGLSARTLEIFGHRSGRETHRIVSLSPRRSRRLPRRGFLYGKASARRHKHGTSSEQTISTARTAVRSACCLPETRGANRLQQPCSSNPYFPPAPLRSLCKIGQIVLKQETSEYFSCFLLPFEAKSVSHLSLHQKRDCSPQSLFTFAFYFE